MISNEEIAKRVTRGTTTKYDKVQVLFNDGEWALVKWPGCSREQVSPWVDQYKIADIKGQYSTGRSDMVWRSDVNGRLTDKRVHELVVDLRLDPAYLVKKPTQERGEPGATLAPTKGTKKRRYRLETAGIQVCMFVEDDPPEDWDTIIEQAVTVGNITETGMQINGYYFLIEYETATDLFEFLKHDREKILDELENAS